MERNTGVREGLRRSNARFMASMNRILEQYNHPFVDDLLVSMDTLTYDTPDGPKQWGQVSRNDVKKWKEKLFKKDRRRNRETSKQQSSDFEDEHSTVDQESSENSGVDTSDIGEERGDIGSVRRKFEEIDLQVEFLVKGHRLTSPLQELFDNQAVVCRKELELSNESSSSKYLQLQHSHVPISSNTITSPRHQPFPELSTTLCDSIHGEYLPADEGCSWSNTTLADLYPAMVEILTKLMAKQSHRRVLKHIFGHLRSKRWHFRRPKLNITVDKMTRSRPCKLKRVFRSPCSCRSEDNNQAHLAVDVKTTKNPAFGNESREFCFDNSLISNSSGLVPYAYTDTNEIKMDYSDSNSEQHLTSRKGQVVCKHTAFPDVMGRMEETFIVEDELQPTASPKNSEYTGSEKLAYTEPSFITSTANSESRVLHLVKESKTQKTDFCVGTSELCSCSCSSPGNSNNSIPITNCSPARSSNTVFKYPEKIISERQTSFQHKDWFSSCFTKQSPSKMPNKYKDAFEEFYYKVCSEEFQKPLTLTRPLLNSQNLEEKGSLVKRSLSDVGRSIKQCDKEFDRLYEKLSRESFPKFPAFQRASNLLKYEEIQMPETVNALVNSPVRTYSAISRVKRAGSSQNYLPCSPLKRLKLTPEHCFSSRKYQEIFHSKTGPQTAGMDFLSTYSCNNSSFFKDHSYHCQGSGSHDSSDKTFLCIPGTSLQESRTASEHYGWPGAMENCSSPRNVRKYHSRVYRKLSYTDEKEQLYESLR
ncbi:Holliday junction recognition protein [Parus major]|uniref:Holliday junction recognition protein n=1 Tax=Parus major TaxID=9157 RepID=UPI0007715CB9|nr:Holliday junction recognition protein [Parus major]